ncbi:aspartate aminotransferase family protein [Limisphaera sp. VF-2]|jgi:4-aminobutyrate aminotransferase-like enzyme|uniref:aspartate aminotransferase family protein n=1 Tax=Limisphaera sp. VF-2 TaxID=3400418 RepID=UPI0017643DA3
MGGNADWLRRLARYEARNVTFVDPDGRWPVVWERARGVWVWDVEGRRYLDLTAAFGVAAAGHANPKVVRAACTQARRLLHGMGDVHPHPPKVELARALSRWTYERWTRGTTRRAHGRVILGCSGFEAVEVALKTAMRATGRAGVVAFEGSYHGLGYGALNVTHREYFWRPFEAQLRRFGSFVTYPRRAADLDEVWVQLDRAHRRRPVGAVLVEPVQGRGGIRVPPPEFLPMLRQWCEARGALLVVDEVFTGFGRTGAWFACEHSRVVPDLICLGKALTGGFPLSACVGRAEVMDAAWPASEGEALHTSTFQGHPVGCAMALAHLEELHRLKLAARAARVGEWLMERLRALPGLPGLEREVRGLGLMVGMELRWRDGRPATAVVVETLKRMLERGFLMLPEGAAGEVLAWTPPLTVPQRWLERAVTALEESLREAVRQVTAGTRGRR